MAGGRIVVGVDASEPAAGALAWAVAEGALTEAPVRVVHAWHYPALSYGPGLVLPPSFARGDFERDAGALVDKALSAVPAEEAQIERAVVEGGAASVLVEESRDAALLVVGHRGRGGFLALRLGSVALQCALHAECPVVVVRPAPLAASTGHQARIVVGVDGSQPSRRALLWAAHEARHRDATVEIVHCWRRRSGLPRPSPLPANRDSAEAAAHAVMERAVRAVEGRSPRAEPILVDAPPAATLVDASAGAALVVVGTRGHGGFPGLLLGSVSTQVLDHAHCPTVVVR